MKKILFAVLASSIAFCSACSDSDSSNVDFAKFCDNVMGKSCGHPISDALIQKCERVYASELRANDDCKKELTKYYNCVADLKASANACFDANACKKELNAASSCMNKNKVPDVDYNAFCTNVMGKNCSGKSISDNSFNRCVNVYSAETKNHPLCSAQAVDYYSCVINAGANAACSGSDDTLCKEKANAYSSCLDDKYPKISLARKALIPAEGATGPEVDFDLFARNVMGKSCYNDMSEDDVKWGAKLYGEEFLSHAECADSLKEHFKCVNALQFTPCADPKDENCTCMDTLDDATCMAKLDVASSCLVEKYPAEMIGESVDYDEFCNVIMGKACGYDISDADMKWCADMYKAEALNYDECSSEAYAYFKCVIDIETNNCAGKENCSCYKDENACKTEVNAYSSCITAKYGE